MEFLTGFFFICWRVPALAYYASVAYVDDDDDDVVVVVVVVVVVLVVVVVVVVVRARA